MVEQGNLPDGIVITGSGCTSTEDQDQELDLVSHLTIDLPDSSYSRLSVSLLVVSNSIIFCEVVAIYGEHPTRGLILGNKLMHKTSSTWPGIIIAIVYSSKIQGASLETLHNTANTYTAAALFFGGLTVGTSPPPLSFGGPQPLTLAFFFRW